MKYILFLQVTGLISILSALILSGCGQSGSVSGNGAEIPQSETTITFQISGGMPDVTFTHRTHAEAYLNNDCMVCHAHTNIRDNTIWDCDQCHSSEDNEGWCPDDADGHDCWMVQCQQCHQQQDPPTTPNCVDCH